MMKKKRFVGIFVAVAAVFLVFSSVGNAPALAGQTTDEILAKKYAKILGSYTYEGTDAAIEIVIRQGALWADDGDGYPVELKPVGDSLEEFGGEDANNGHFDFKFLKDEKGEYSKCHIVAAAAGLDITAFKIK